MIVIKELKYASLDNISKMLHFMRIEELRIFSIHNELDIKPTFVSTNKGSLVEYMEVKLDSFTTFLNLNTPNFLDYNKHSLYIIRGGNYVDIKYLFKTINKQEVNLGRGGSQRAHMLSPLDFRLSSYMLAMTGFNNNLVNELNTFNYISKDRYLSWTDKLKYLSKLKKSKHLKNTIFKSIYVKERADNSKLVR